MAKDETLRQICMAEVQISKHTKRKVQDIVLLVGHEHAIVLSKSREDLNAALCRLVSDDEVHNTRLGCYSIECVISP